jgi:hypothetical protein
MAMYDVVVYLSSLPRIADRNRKVEVLQAFAAGCTSLGLKTLLQSHRQLVPTRLAVILGWVGQSIRGSHIQLRQDVIANQRVMSIDGSCFKFADPNSVFLRYSLDGVYYNTNQYANAMSGPEKWNQIRQTLGLDLKPWRRNGNHVLVCGQRDGGWSMKGIDMNQWALDTVRQIRLATARPILVRPHPRNPIDPRLFKGIPHLQFSQGTTLQQDIQNSWASVFFNSSSCVAALLAGVPVFASDADCVGYAVANKDIGLIENPAMPDREQWLYDLSAAHWTDVESRSGQIYQKFQQFLPA